MSEKNFSIDEALKYGWKKMTENLGFFIVLVLVSFLISSFFNVFSGIFQERIPSLSILFTIGGIIFSVFINIVYIRVALNIYGGDRGKVEDILTLSLPLFFKFLLANVLYFLIVAAGFLLLIVPGIYFAVKYQFVLYLVVDKKMDVVPAFNMSSEMTKGVKWKLLLFDLLLVVLAMVGFAVFFVGFLVAFPIIMMAAVYVYRTLFSETGIDISTPDTSSGQPSIDSGDPFKTPVSPS